MIVINSPPLRGASSFCFLRFTMPDADHGAPTSVHSACYPHPWLRATWTLKKNEIREDDEEEVGGA